jgi:hypothetical protein
VTRIRRSRELLRQTIRAVRFAATDERIPRPLRLLVAVGLLPVPGPFDEVVLLVAAVPIVVLYREPLADAWKRAADLRESRGSPP